MDRTYRCKWAVLTFSTQPCPSRLAVDAELRWAAMNFAVGHSVPHFHVTDAPEPTVTIFKLMRGYQTVTRKRTKD